MERAQHRRSKSVSTSFQGIIPPIQKYRSNSFSRFSSNLTSYNNGSMRDDMYMMERESSSMRPIERPTMAKYEKLMRERERGREGLMSREGLINASIWTVKHKSRLPRGVRSAPMIMNPPINGPPSSRSRSAESTRQKIDTKHLSLGEFMMDYHCHPLHMHHSREILMNYVRRLDSSCVASHPQRLDGLLLVHGARVARTSSTDHPELRKKEKKKKKKERVVSSYGHHLSLHGDHRKMKGLLHGEDVSWRMNGSYYDAVFSHSNSNGTRKLAKKVIHQLHDDDDHFHNESKACKWSSRKPSMDHDHHCGSCIFGGDSNLGLVSGGASGSRDTWRGVIGEDNRHGKIRVKGYPMHRNFNLAQGPKPRSKKKPIAFPPIRVKEKDSVLETTFEIPRESSANGVSERDEDPIFDIMIDKQEITSSTPLPPGESSSLLHPMYSSHEDHHHQHGHIPHVHQEPHDERSKESPSSSGQPVDDLERFMDGGHGNPISVPNVEDPSSSSPIFDGVNNIIELNEVSMKAVLLKFLNLEEVSENWEVSYTLDVLIQSGFQDFGLDMCDKMWDYPDHPLDPTLFDTMDDKYGDHQLLRSERMLLFDRINSAFSQMFQKQVDLHPWLMPKLVPRRAEDHVIEKLMSHESIHWQVSELVVREMKLGDHHIEEVVLMVSRIEGLLLDDIITEFLYQLFWG